MLPSTSEAETAARPLRIAVDLTPLLAGGGNGGVKPFIFEYISWLGSQRIRRLQFVFLTGPSSHSDVRDLAHFDDELICILTASEAGGFRTAAHSPKERACYDPPGNLLQTLNVDILYAPFGHCRWHCPGIPTIATAVDTLHRDYPQSLRQQDIAFRESLFTDMVARADLIQCISHFTMDRMAESYGVPRERMFCSYIAIHERLRRAREPVRASEAAPYFLFPANAWKHKNHAVLLLAYGIYRERMRKKAWDLVLTGHDDHSMREVLKLAESLNVGQHVRYLGHLDDDDYTDIWAKAGALLFPTLYEGFGIPLVEAMAFGLPIIASRSGSIEEIGGDACLFVDPRKPDDLATAMERVSSDAGLRRELSERSRMRLWSFSFQADAALFLEKIISCASSPARISIGGIYADQWTAPLVSFNSPAWRKFAQLSLEILPMPESRDLDVRCNGDLIASHAIPAGVGTELAIPVYADGRMFSLEIPNASSLSATDHRVHGLLLKSLNFHAAGREKVNLLALNK